jgi:hypothetical protein
VIGEYLRDLMERDILLGQTAQWKIIEEDTSLSTLENQMFAKALIAHHHLNGPITLFCDVTRRERAQAVAQKVFNEPVTVVGVDFDITRNRYIDSDVLQKKEALATKESLWTLEDPARLAPHHEFFLRKLEFLRERQRQGLSHVDAVHEWTTQMADVIRELMPEHPYLKTL